MWNMRVMFEVHLVKVESYSWRGRRIASIEFSNFSLEVYCVQSFSSSLALFCIFPVAKDLCCLNLAAFTELVEHCISISIS